MVFVNVNSSSPRLTPSMVTYSFRYKFDDFYTDLAVCLNALSYTPGIGSLSGTQAQSTALLQSI